MACVTIDPAFVSIIAMLTAPRVARDAIEAYHLTDDPRQDEE